MNGSVGGPVRHIPVMLDEVLRCLKPVSGEVVIDGTFGAGGYTGAILDAGARVIAIDRDPGAIAGGRDLALQHEGMLELVEGRFSELDRIAGECGHGAVDGVVLDIGVSSMQIDEAERGFSFQKDGPLDMRMSRSGPSAADVVNEADISTLTRIIGVLGEERHAPRIARAIGERRKSAPFLRTLDLARLVEATIGRKPGDRIHPATRTFQGLRIYINRELDELAGALFAAERVLRPGGRLAVVTFHSLEDRIVKKFLASRSGGGGGSRHMPDAARDTATFQLETRSALAAGEEEALRNPRARSAKLRCAVRTAAPARAGQGEELGVPAFRRARKEPRSVPRA